jgi:glycosyltransferase involved in cell wall biosynthesis
MEEENEMAADFASAGIDVHAVPRHGMIFEDRLRLSYLAAAPFRPQAVLSCLGSGSFELLRLVPEGTVRLGIIQSDEPGTYRMTRFFTPWLDAIVGVSGSICANLRADPAFARVRVEHIPYGISFGPANDRRQRDLSQPIRLVYAGRVIEEQKRLSRIVELIRRLNDRGLSFEFTIAGNGPELPPIRNSLREMSHVHLLGEVANSEVTGLLRSHDIFVLLSDYEGLPLSLLEAMGEGLVPVVSDLESGIRDVVTESNGVRVPVGNVSAAADAIISLVQKPENLTRLSASAAQWVRTNYSATKMGEQYLQLVKQLAKPQKIWPGDVLVPPPVMLSHAWMYQGLPRRVRRLLKHLRPA